MKQKWLGVIGSRLITETIEQEIIKLVTEKMKSGNSIVTGGAPGADFIAARTALNIDPSGERIKIFLPTEQKIYMNYFNDRVSEGKITEPEITRLSLLLDKIKITNPDSIIENNNFTTANASSFHNRNNQIVDLADELLAFSVNNSSGTAYTIEKAKEKGIPVKIFNYSIPAYLDS